ncbi:MAG: FadR family transcriptional regulator [Thermoleophilia bacterium]|nr:FadR family transcriptional regulator [Thermoleophilia bacterium]
MKNMFKPVRPRRLADEAREQIEELVRSGRIEAGAKLPPERELMALLSVSRTSLREAIRALESVGMLRVVPGRGTFVSEQSAASLAQDWYTWLLGHKQEVVQILEVHEALEVKVAELAAERIDDEGAAQLAEYLDAMARAVEQKDHAALVAADAGFHRGIREAGGNVIIARILNDLEDHVLDARRAIMSIPSRVQRVISDHRAILEGIAASDPEAAALATLLHVRRSKEEIVGSGLLTLRTPRSPEASGSPGAPEAAPTQPGSAEPAD